MQIKVVVVVVVVVAVFTSTTGLTMTMYLCAKSFICLNCLIFSNSTVKCGMDAV